MTSLINGPCVTNLVGCFYNDKLEVLDLFPMAVVALAVVVARVLSLHLSDGHAHSIFVFGVIL